jgi:hypothetical protein
MQLLLSTVATFVVAFCSFTAAHPLGSPYGAIEKCTSEHPSFCDNVELPNQHKIDDIKSAPLRIPLMSLNTEKQLSMSNIPPLPAGIAHRLGGPSASDRY